MQDDDGFREVLQGREDGGGDPLLKEAARACPVGAIHPSYDRVRARALLSGSRRLPGAPGLLSEP